MSTDSTQSLPPVGGSGRGASSFLTIASPASGEYSEKRSKFLAFALPVKTAEEAMAHVARFQKEYYDARHVCFAYMLGADREVFRANDNGEPSGTAGKPILGQINSRMLTDILVVVVRYFGGVKLGTSGLIVAYRLATQAALDNAEVVERTVDEQLTVSFGYLLMNSVMRIVKEEEPQILDQQFDNDCLLTLSIRKDKMPRLRERLSQVIKNKE
ncbi:MAG: YigZ family protein [Bacteroidaceae bacterium]|nr:YigZ family protein [Bacteroidaceae bacterium]